MVDYVFYVNSYLGGSIPEDEFPALVKRAEAQLERYKRIYTVEALKEDSEGMAICAMADALYYFDCAQNGGAPGMVASASIGSVSVSYGGAGASSVDLSAKGQAAELYRCASLYLDIYRGCC